MLDQMKIKNLTNILVCLFSRKYATKAELVRYTGLSNSTVSSAVNSLLKLGLLVCVGMRDSIGGRRSVIYRLNKEYGHFIGIDLNGGSADLVVTDCENNSVYKVTQKIERDTPVIHQLNALIERILVSFPKVLGIGIGLSGEIEFERQIVVQCGEFGWQHVPLKEIVERRFMIFTYIDHRVNGAAIREGLIGQAARMCNYLCIYESCEEKSALILNGNVCRGEKNRTGLMPLVSTFFTAADMLFQFLDISKIFIGYCTEKFKIEAENAVSSFKERLYFFPEPESVFALGMAAAAEKEWFQSIYFRL